MAQLVSASCLYTANEAISDAVVLGSSPSMGTPPLSAIAHLAERPAVNRKVDGSSPSGGVENF